MKPLNLLVILLACSMGSFAQDPVYDADNGLTASGTSTTRKISLGGTLTANTTIALGGFNLVHTGTGNIGIGTSSPSQKLQVSGTVYSTGFKLDAGNSIFWGDPNTHITRNSTVLEFQEYTGAFVAKGVSGFSFKMEHPTYGNAVFSFPSDKTFALTNKESKVFETSAPNNSTVWIKVGGSAAHYTDGPGTQLYLFGGPGGVNGVQNGGSVFIDGGIKGTASATDGNIIIGNTKGNVLVGTATDNGNKLQVNGTTHTTGFKMPTGAGAGKVLTSDANGVASWQTGSGGSGNFWSILGSGTTRQIGTTANNEELQIITNGNPAIFVAPSGSVTVGGSTGISNTGYKLWVEGNIRTRKLRVDQNTWPDYVFEPNYSLRPINEVEQFILAYKHLPEVPSAEEVKKEGIDLGDNQAVLLKKIEELTLYIIGQNKRLDTVEKELKELKKK